MNKKECKPQKQPPNIKSVCNPLTGKWVEVGKNTYNNLLKTFTAEDLEQFTQSIISKK